MLCLALNAIYNHKWLLAHLLILFEKSGLLHLKFGFVDVNIYLWAR